MHVLILSQIFPPDLGGSATRAYNIARGLVLNRMKVTVIAGFPHYPTGNVPKKLRRRALSIDNMDGFNLVRTFIPPLSAKGLANRMILFLSFIISSIFPIFIIRKIDIIYASNPQIFSILPALLYKVFHRCPIILNVDDLWPEDPEDLGLIKSNFLKDMGKVMAKIAYTIADAITPISPGYVKVICEKYSITYKKVHVVRGGVDARRFKPTTIKKSGKFIVLYSGAFSVAYDFNQVIKAAKLLEQYRDIEIVLQGSGELIDSAMKSVKELNIKNIRIIDRVLSRNEVAELLNQADVLLLPLRSFKRPYLGISSKLYEYQAVGKPIICCAEGQPAEYVQNTNSGIVVRPGDYKALAEAILYLKENKEVREKMGISGRLFVENNLSIEKVGEKMVAVFSSL
ncbi:MAG: glycosyltransferase family 4 protein [Nitrososphaerales archaeon]